MSHTPLLSGRLCFRELSSGTALAGVVTLEPNFQANETDCFALVRATDNTWMMTSLEEDKRRPLDTLEQSYGLGNLLTLSVWPTPARPDVLPVRLVEAFPETNTWTLMGVSSLSFKDLAKAAKLPAHEGAHHWMDVRQGKLEAIEAPFQASGMAMSQLLPQEPVWPDAAGTPHTLPVLSVAWREHFHAYHRRMLDGLAQGQSWREIQESLQADPILRHCSPSSRDMLFLDYLQEMDAMGALEVEAPRTVAQVQARHALVKKAMTKVMGLEDPDDEPTSRRTKPGF